MYREAILLHVALLHAAFVCALVAALGLAGLPVRGALLGGGAMAVSLGLLWGMARAVLAPQRRSVLALLGSLKVLLYLGLVSAALTGRLVTDGAGFGAGVACFLLAAVVVAVSRPLIPQVAR
ncbi:MAG: hypothetical protein ACREQY_17615 [Candidatus Binatia bacterium]